MNSRGFGTNVPADLSSIWTVTSDAPIDTALGAAIPLSLRQRAVLERIGLGMSNKEIAKDLRITPETVKSHVKSIFAKLTVERRAHAVARALSLGIIKSTYCDDGLPSPVS